MMPTNPAERLVAEIQETVDQLPELACYATSEVEFGLYLVADAAKEALTRLQAIRHAQSVSLLDQIAADD